MADSIYIINPASDFPNYVSAEILAASGFAAGTAMADAAAATVAALASKDFQVSICDEYISPIDFDHTADWVAITGKVNQRRRMVAVADEFRRRGKRVVIGGPYASLSPAHLRAHCDVLVSGEVEEIAAELFADLSRGNPRDSYIGDKPDISRSPIPRWALYPNDRALMGTLQTSRGCPFECEFCDVIQDLGRKQRHKPIANVLAELDLFTRSAIARFSSQTTISPLIAPAVRSCWRRWPGGDANIRWTSLRKFRSTPPATSNSSTCVRRPG